MADEQTPLSEGTTEPSIAEVMAFDPFAPENKAPEKEAAKTGDEAGTVAAETDPKAPVVPVTAKSPVAPVDPKAPKAPVAPVPPVPPKPDPAASGEAALRETAQAIRDLVAKTAPAAADKPEPTAPKFNLGIPDQLLGALRSEDPAEFKLGMTSVLNGVANHVYNTIQESIQKEFLPAIPQMIERYVENIRQQQAVATDFYGAYPSLANEALKPFVQQVGAHIAQQRAAAGKSLAWGPELRDEIANYIFEQIPALKVAPAAAPVPPVKPNGKHFTTGSSARPEVPAANSAMQDMHSVLTGARS